MINQEVYQPDFNTIPQAPEAIEEFEKFEFDTEKLDIPSVNLAQTNAQIVALSFLHSLGQIQGSGRGIRSEMERFSFAYKSIFNQNNWEDFINEVPFNDVSGHKKFTRFLEEMIELQDPEDVNEMWREVLSCSVIFTLKDDIKDELLRERMKYNSNYELLEACFS
jgi:hypothetical protein